MFKQGSRRCSCRNPVSDLDSLCPRCGGSLPPRPAYVERRRRARLARLMGGLAAAVIACAVLAPLTTDLRSFLFPKPAPAVDTGPEPIHFDRLPVACKPPVFFESLLSDGGTLVTVLNKTERDMTNVRVRARFIDAAGKVFATEVQSFPRGEVLEPRGQRQFALKPTPAGTARIDVSASYDSAPRRARVVPRDR